MERNAVDEVLITVNDEYAGHWVAKFLKPAELANYLKGRAECDPGEQFKLWHIDADGVPRECEIQVTAGGYDENDWSQVAVRVARKDTGEFVAGTGYRVDGRA